MQRTSGIVAILAAAMLSGCVSIDDGGDSVITHTDHTITSAERDTLMAHLQSTLKAPGLRVRGLQSSENLTTGAVTVCGFVSGMTPAGTRSPEAVFGGMFSKDGRQFMLFGGGGKGQDADRAAQVRVMCGAAKIYL